MTKLHDLAELGQSAWLDYIHHKLIASGGLMSSIQMGVRGITSNPAIFEQSIAKSTVYDGRIKKLAMEGVPTADIYDLLVVDEIRKAADILHPLYLETGGGDGFVSLEVNPHLAHDKDGSVREAKRLFNLVNRPNVMIKIPATSEGVQAIQEALTEGININVTLMFSPAQYEMTAEAYLSALERYAPKVQSLSQVSSVASLFISRVDVMVDKMLDELGTSTALALKGRIGIANAKLIYNHYFMEIFQGNRWDVIATRGARLQRLLFGSTSVKNPEYPDTMYMDNLIGPFTVNTAPPKTLDAFMDHGTVSTTLTNGVKEARKQMDELSNLGINMEAVTRQLLDEGIDKFIKPYDKSIAAIKKKQAEFIAA